ncbi:MAG: cation:proton antiporter [Rhodospirillaceae bacterium]|nr:cation:proton antiporter [Rhodospirillaceae bacterium]MBT5566573.1 cation:proton antiporter [Rhodospirillaceae bacterium]MBT6090662.1 cation:proton antiporter [Rhodospirillaceae bacterium]MBT7449799.1 cation:proton antiporter [Rhodospirillaceae bacterium]
MDVLLELVVIWVGVYIAVVAAAKTRLTPVLYYLAIGCLFVNLGVLPEKSDDFVRGLAELGIILIMFALGFEEKTNHFVQSIKKSWGIAFFGAVAPFTTAYVIADYFWGDSNIALMCGLTMTATAVSLTMVSLKSEGLSRSPAATRIMTSAVLDDIASLALVAILVPIAAGGAEPSAIDILATGLKAAGFFVLITFIGGWILPAHPKGWFGRIPVIGRLGIQNLFAFGRGEYAFLAILLLAVGVGLLAHEFGFHPAIGAYMAGLILKEEYFHAERTDTSYKEIKGTLDMVAFTAFGPIFFVNLGTNLVFEWDVFVSVIPQTVTLTLAIFISQIVSAALAARYTSAMDWPNSLMIGFGMLGRAELAFVVMDIAYVQNSILSTEAFYTLMLTAFWLNVAVPITISLWKPYCKTEDAGSG